MCKYFHPKIFYLIFIFSMIALVSSQAKAECLGISSKQRGYNDKVFDVKYRTNDGNCDYIGIVTRQNSNLEKIIITSYPTNGTVGISNDMTTTTHTWYKAKKNFVGEDSYSVSACLSGDNCYLDIITIQIENNLTVEDKNKLINKDDDLKK